MGQFHEALLGKVFGASGTRGKLQFQLQEFQDAAPLLPAITDCQITDARRLLWQALPKGTRRGNVIHDLPLLF